MKPKSLCLNKRWYHSKEQAERKMTEIIIKSKINLTRAYQCPYCKGWHLTSK